MNADLNAIWNMGVLGRSEYLRLFANESKVASSEVSPTAIFDGSYKPPNQLGGS